MHYLTLPFEKKNFFSTMIPALLSKHILLLSFVHYVCATLISFEFLKLAKLFSHLRAFSLAILLGMLFSNVFKLQVLGH